MNAVLLDWRPKRTATAFNLTEPSETESWKFPHPDYHVPAKATGTEKVVDSLWWPSIGAVGGTNGAVLLGV